MTHHYSEEQLTLLNLAGVTSNLRNDHHHHHHYKDIEYEEPTHLTTSMGLLALKKLHAMDPTFMKVRDARLLDAVAPGAATYYINAAISIGSGMWGVYVWRTAGWRGFVGRGGIILAGLYVAHKATMVGVNRVRQTLYSQQRKKLVENYVQTYGEDYLIKVLNPAFRML